MLKFNFKMKERKYHLIILVWIEAEMFILGEPVTFF